VIFLSRFTFMVRSFLVSGAGVPEQSRATLRGKTTALAVGAIATVLFAVAAGEARADLSDYGLDSVGASLSTSQAGAHPDFATSFSLKIDPTTGAPFATTKEVRIALPPGMLGNPTAYPQCSMSQFANISSGGGFTGVNCPQDSQVGTVLVEGVYSSPLPEPIYNLAAPTSGAAVGRLGFIGSVFPFIVDIGVRSASDYGLTSTVQSTGGASLRSATTTIWGVPADPAHDGERFTPLEALSCRGPCDPNPRPSGVAPRAFLSNPTSCGPQQVGFAAASFANPDLFDTASAPLPDTTGCASVPFDPSISLQPTTQEADSPSGLDVNLHLPQQGLTEPAGGLRSADLKKAVVTLPEGMALNPSAGDGLAGCSEAQIGLTSEGPIHFDPSDPACPDGSKVGTVKITTPLLADPLEGSLYLADPSDNPFHSLLTGYLVAKGSGVTLKLAGRFDLDPQTGRITATFDNNPQQPFSDLALHFKGGSRGALVTPPSCGTYQVHTQLVPWSAADPDNPTPAETADRTTSFQVTSGPGGGPCPPGGTAPFHPGFEAGTLNNSAGSYSPFVLRLTRKDGEQDMTRFSTVLPPGVVGKLAGVAKCPQSQVAIAKAKTGRQEQASPSCPASSRIGRTLAGAGVGSTLVYVGGKLYLGGPYHGDPLSVIAIVPAVAGPFDLGDVVVQEALTLNPLTAEVEVDGAASDPLPHILAGIPLNVRDIRVYADRPEFTLNPTSCEVLSARATLWGGGTALFPTSETPVGLGSRFQAADCASLGFKPKLAIKLKGGTKRGSHPALKAVVTPRPGDANFSRAVVTLPHSAFLAQAHIRTICTRVQFAANGGNGAGCPAASVYGRARAWSPLLEEALEGPVFLRSSNHNLPDLVVALHGLVNIDLAARIDSIHGGIRSTFEDVPDAPVSRFILEMQGAKKGLIVNSTNLCAGRHLAVAKLSGQNGKGFEAKPAVGASCGGKKKGKHK
jgi:hypothetical protein